MPLRKEPPLISDANTKTPIFQAHGDADYTVRGIYGGGGIGVGEDFADLATQSIQSVLVQSLVKFDLPAVIIQQQTLECGPQLACYSVG